jgi:NTE family protein
MESALVLGAGGITGVAWQLGVLIGLRQEGVDATGVDRIVGTSAGAVTGALVATGVEPERAAVIEEFVDTPIRPDWVRGAEAFALLNDASLELPAIRSGVGALALAAEVGDEEAYVDSLAKRLPVHEWPPDGRLRLTAVDTANGEPVIWDGGVPLVRAVAASCAVPCILPPVRVNGRRYMDGGVRSYTNADVANGADAVLVLAPRSPVRLRRSPAEEAAALRDSARVTVVKPDAASTAAVGDRVFDLARWQPTLEAGIAQGRTLAETVATRLGLA